MGSIQEPRDLSAGVRDMSLTGAGARTEHYEIASYTGLITMARGMGETEAAKLLRANLAQEKEALKKMDTIAKRLATSREGAAAR